MKWLTCILITVSTSIWADNLLANPGFDAMEANGFPKNWDVFVMPMDGAKGQLDSERHDGEYAAMLYTPQPYSKEPINNWSQVIYDNLSGQELWVSGTIRVEEATEAAIWLQCFTNNPLRVIASSSTTSDHPIYGTQGWTKVHSSIKVPSNTDFIVVRCVLIGTGRAWFDTLQVSTNKSDHIPLEEITPIDEQESDHLEALHLPTPEEEASLHDILQLTLDMQDTIQRLESTNDALVNRIESIRRELSMYRNELTENQAVLENIKPATTSPHPLVPFGYYNKEL
ncbi:MAG: hypothetical protein COA73_00130 [Candidatus Hydrogenedentota bacterium]|nr:MAG: hypothetical protein COA73_00130 [Candidatus Hydrogenedentota bacterium]